LYQKYFYIIFSLQVLGTVVHAGPELLDGGVVDARADIQNGQGASDGQQHAEHGGSKDSLVYLHLTA